MHDVASDIGDSITLALPVLYSLRGCDYARSFDLGMSIDIDIEILFCAEYYTTCSINPVGLLLQQSRINKHF